MIKDFFSNNDIYYLEDVDLTKYNTYRLHSKVKGMVFPNTINELIIALKFLKDKNIPYMFLGNGSNIIFAREYYDKVFIKLDKLNNYEIKDELLTAEAGVSLIKLSLECAKKGLSGLEFTCALPGLVGSSVAMNAGAYNSSLSDILVSAKVLTKDLEIKTMMNNELKFDYRHSIFKTNRDLICLEATFKLEKKNSDEIMEVMNKRQHKRRETQPLEYPCAGSVFRNPDGLFAGKLIEDCGLKGININGAEVSTKHANFIINKGDATGEDIIKLINLIKEKVYTKFKVELILEQEIIY